MKEYAIIDVETTGYGASGNRITDIAIFIHDGKKVLEEYQTFVNPETYIPENITRLTRITNEMVANAPKFYEVAKKVFQMTENRVFVAHNVNFDYSVIKNEFARLGGKYEREILCTVKLSRRLIPGHESYSLGRLCSDLSIHNEDRHRAYGDAKATVELFEILYLKAFQNGEGDFKSIKAQKQLNFPPLLDKEKYDNLPETYGVYYFLNEKGVIIYVGKANNIKQRVASHFNDKSRKEQQLFENTADINYEITGSELVALLLESAEIKRIYPQYNHAQKKLVETHAIYSFEDGNGIIQMLAGKKKKGIDSIISFYNIHQSKNVLNSMIREFELCPRYCGLEKTKGSCFNYSVKKCRGICAGQESIDAYNERVEQAISSLKVPEEDFYIRETGRNEEESALISVKNGVYQGFGFVHSSVLENDDSNLDEYIVSYPSNLDSQRIVRQYLRSDVDTELIKNN